MSRWWPGWVREIHRVGRASHVTARELTEHLDRLQTLTVQLEHQVALLREVGAGDGGR